MPYRLPYQVLVRTARGRQYTTEVQFVQAPDDVSEDRARATVEQQLDDSWQPTGLFNLGDQVSIGDTHFRGQLMVNASVIEAIQIVWLDPKTVEPPAREAAGGPFQEG